MLGGWKEVWSTTNETLVPQIFLSTNCKSDACVSCWERMSCRQGSRMSVTCWRQLSLVLLQMSGNCDLSVMSGEAVTHFLSLPSLSSFHCMNENTSCHLPTCFRTTARTQWPVHTRQAASLCGPYPVETHRYDACCFWTPSVRHSRASCYWFLL